MKCLMEYHNYVNGMCKTSQLEALSERSTLIWLLSTISVNEILLIHGEPVNLSILMYRSITDFFLQNTQSQQVVYK